VFEKSYFESIKRPAVDIFQPITEPVTCRRVNALSADGASCQGSANEWNSFHSIRDWSSIIGAKYFLAWRIWPPARCNEIRGDGDSVNYLNYAIQNFAFSMVLIFFNLRVMAYIDRIKIDLFE
jgi:hypothetical protein